MILSSYAEPISSSRGFEKMIEKIRGIQNPLTIIAIFAGLAEVAGTVALATANKEVQPTFVWFVMGFPTLLVVAFFLTLNFNPRVLYAPSDFRTDDNFLHMLSGGRAMNENFRSLAQQLEVASRSILEETVKQLGEASSKERARLTVIVGEQMSLLREKVESTRESVVETTFATIQSREVVRCENCSLVQYRSANSLCRKCRQPIESADDGSIVTPNSKFQADVLRLLLSKNEPMRITDLAQAVKRGEAMTTRAVERLASRGLVEVSADNSGCLQVTHTDESRRSPNH